jgi:hypothetical protein
MSDHCAVFAQLDIESILSATVKPIDSITARKLNQATPKERAKFLQEADTFLEAHGIYEKLKRLNNKPPSEWDHTDVDVFEKCDDMIIQGVLHAEKAT